MNSSVLPGLISWILLNTSAQHWSIVGYVADPTLSTENIEADITPTYRSYYAMGDGLRGAIGKIVRDFEWQRPFADLERDTNHVYHAVRRYLKGMPAREVNFQIQVLGSAFYRNKAAYIIGKAINGPTEYPFAIPVIHDDGGKLFLDTILLDAWRIGLLFSLSRAYFMVDMEVPSGYVQFLRSILPNKPYSELYIMLGLGKQGKTMFFRDFIYHLHHSEDKFIMAPGIRGMVMLVFTLPSYPYVFKIIKDVFGSSKEMDRATVKRKFMMVKQVDRVGRMADTLEFSNAAFPLKRFNDEVLEELRMLAPSCFEIDGDALGSAEATPQASVQRGAASHTSAIARGRCGSCPAIRRVAPARPPGLSVTKLRPRRPERSAAAARGA